jgi:enoyl-CoA hydratase
MEQITIGAIEGFCIGGGVALAVALDFRVMARNGHMRVPEIGLGMNMSWQSVPRMLHLIGPARTKQAVILADQRISAQEAHEWGLVEQDHKEGVAAFLERRKPKFRGR